jgi:hypothetical protein
MGLSLVEIAFIPKQRPFWCELCCRDKKADEEMLGRQDEFIQRI